MVENLILRYRTHFGSGLVIVILFAAYTPCLCVDWKYKTGIGVSELKDHHWQEAVNALTEANEGLRTEMRENGSSDSLAAKKLLQYLGAAHLKLAQECLGTHRLLAADSHAAIAVEIFSTIPWVPKGDLSLAYSAYGLAKDSLSAHDESLELHRKSLILIEAKAGEFDPIRALFSLRTAEAYVALGRDYEAEPLYMSALEILDSVLVDAGRSLGQVQFVETLIPPTKKPPKFKDWFREMRVSSHLGYSRTLRAMERTSEADSVLARAVSEMSEWKRVYCVARMDKEFNHLFGDSAAINDDISAQQGMLDLWNTLKLKAGPAVTARQAGD